MSGRDANAGEPKTQRSLQRVALPYGGYMRVSDVGGRDERLRSPEFQHRAIEGKATGAGVAVKFYPPELDVSGAKRQRKILDSIVDAIERRELGGIIVYNLARLSRLKPRERIELVERIEDAGGVILSASESFDVSTPEGRFQRELFFSLARMEWERMAAGFDVAKSNAIAQGIAVNSRPPFGYRHDADHRLVKEPTEADTLRALFEIRAGNGSYGDVLMHFEAATGRTSSRQTMREMLANRVYLGELRYGRKDQLVNEQAHEPIVDAALFERAQDVTKERRGPNAHRGGRPKSLLAGIARCEACGTGLAMTSNGHGVVTYRCPQDAKHCTSRAHILRDELDAYVLDSVVAWLGAAADIEVSAEVKTAASEPARRADLQQRLADAEAHLHDWVTSTTFQATLAPAMYEEGIRARAEAVEAAQADLDALGEETAYEAAKATLRAVLAEGEGSLDERRQLLAVILDLVSVRRTPYRGAPASERATLYYAQASFENPV